MSEIEAKYLGSFPKTDLCPPPLKPEFALIGRSNVGKSSLVNMLCGKHNLAHTSKKPGKTKTLNFFLINDDWILVDLPGYGYAKASAKHRTAWSSLIADYLANRQSLMCTFVLVDLNVPPQSLDIEFINWLGEQGIPFVIVYTKTDRMTSNQVASQMGAFQAALMTYWGKLPEQFLTSSVRKTGRKEILDFVTKVNKSARS